MAMRAGLFFTVHWTPVAVLVGICWRLVVSSKAVVQDDTVGATEEKRCKTRVCEEVSACWILATYELLDTAHR